MKHSVGQSQHWENNRQITRGGGKRERGERKAERRGDGGRNVSYSWMFHEWHTEDKSDWQQLCWCCTHSYPLVSLPLPVPPSLYHLHSSCLSPVCSGTLFLTRLTAVSRRCTKQSWAEVGFPSLAQLFSWKHQCTKDLSMPKDKLCWSGLVRLCRKALQYLWSPQIHSILTVCLIYKYIFPQSAKAYL